MKVTVNIECSPEEARAFMGLPDIAPMQQALMQELEQRMCATVEAMAPENMIKAWTPAGWQNIEQAQKIFWSQIQQTMLGFASTTNNAMSVFAERGAKR